MKTKFVGLLIVALVVCSCSKSKDLVIEHPKEIAQAVICFEKPVLSKSENILIGIRYFKNYNIADKVTLTLNGKQGAMQHSWVEELIGTNYLFKLPPISTAGDYEVVLTIENDQKTFIQKKTLRIVQDYKAATIWDGFDRPYILNSFPLMSMDSVNPSKFYVITDNSLGFTIGLGTYFLTAPANAIGTFIPFIAGINGRYIVDYTDDRQLRSLIIINGSPEDGPHYSYQKTFDEVSNVYGPSTSIAKDFNGNRVATFETGKLLITVHERKSISGVMGVPIVTTITLK